LFDLCSKRQPGRTPPEPTTDVNTTEPKVAYYRQDPEVPPILPLRPHNSTNGQVYDECLMPTDTTTDGSHIMIVVDESIANGELAMCDKEQYSPVDAPLN